MSVYAIALLFHFFLLLCSMWFSRSALVFYIESHVSHLIETYRKKMKPENAFTNTKTLYETPQSYKQFESNVKTKTWVKLKFKLRDLISYRTQRMCKDKEHKKKRTTRSKNNINSSMFPNMEVFFWLKFN